MARNDKVPEREAGPFGRFAYGPSRRRCGEVAEPLTVMAYHARLLLGYGISAGSFCAMPEAPVTTKGAE